MFLNHKDDLDDSDFNNTQQHQEKRQFNFPILPLIIIGGIILLIVIIFLVSKLFNKDKIVYEEKIYYINLIGSTNITMYQGDIFVEPGYKGIDDEGNDLTDEVVVSTNINSEVIGNYKVSYTLGNITKERNVKVIDKPTGATYIHLHGDVNVFLYVGEKYDEKYCDVVDTVDSDILKDKVIINSNVDTSKEGIYKVIYSVTNTRGITTSKVRTVIVMDRNLSLIPSPNEVTNGNVTINIYARDELFDYLVLPNNMKETKSVSTYEVSNNGTYKFIMYNNKGESREKSIEITNIDREVPSGSCSGYYGSGISQITIKAKDNVGISKYEIDGTSYTSSSIKLNKEVSSVNITIYDKAGNTKAISCKLEDKRPTPSSSKPASSSQSKSSTSSSKAASSKPSASSSKPPSSMQPPSTSYRPSGPGTGTSGGDIANISPQYPPRYINNNISVNYYKGSKEFSYWAYIPDKLDKNAPIIVYLPGLGERGNDYYATNPSLAITWGPIHEVYKKGASYQAILIHMQVPSGHSSYEYDHAYIELLNKIANEFKADKNRISVIGASHGCYGIMTLIPNYPNYFSAAVMIGCGNSAVGGMSSYSKHFTSTPTWAFVGGNTDGASSMPGFVNKINELGGEAYYTNIKNGVHNLLNDNYSILRDDQYNVVNWMLSKKR